MVKRNDEIHLDEKAFCFTAYDGPGLFDRGLFLSFGVFGTGSEFMNVSDVQIGMTGYAKTVVQGTEIQTFPVEILGVMKNSGPSGDLILAAFPASIEQ